MFGREFFKPFFKRCRPKNIVFHESKSRFKASIEVNFSPLRSSSSWRAIFIRSLGTLSSNGMEWVRATCLQKRLMPSLRLMPYCFNTAVAISFASLSIRMLVLVRMANSFFSIVPQMGCKKYFVFDFLRNIKDIKDTIKTHIYFILLFAEVTVFDYFSLNKFNQYVMLMLREVYNENQISAI